MSPSLLNFLAPMPLIHISPRHWSVKKKCIWPGRVLKASFPSLLRAAFRCHVEPTRASERQCSAFTDQRTSASLCERVDKQTGTQRRKEGIRERKRGGWCEGREVEQTSHICNTSPVFGCQYRACIALLVLIGAIVVALSHIAKAAQ